ncbi:hypothetical protein ACVWW6_006009 [Bradyrhizobium sp. USDA 3311]
MSFAVSFFARNVDHARSMLHEARAPIAVKALVELTLASIPRQASAGAGASSASTANQARPSDAAKDANAPATPAPQLRGILVETHGHIDEHGAQSYLNGFKVQPLYD